MATPHNPINRFNEIFEQARRSAHPEPSAAALATADEDGMPAVRMVLLKGVDPEGFVFYTNALSKKGQEMAANKRAELCFWWKDIETQVRVAGPVALVSDAEADAYFDSRDHESKVGAWASQQSEPLESREVLMNEYRRLSEEYAGKDVPRPPHWTGYRIAPTRIEFWFGKPNRLHERYEFTKSADGWTERILYP